jgi:tetratricopeptide (TPR) repeat protein
MNAARAKIRREQLIWESVKDSQDVKKIQDYLREFPGGKNAVLAKNKILQLTKPAQTSDAKPPSKTEAAAKQTVLTEIASKRTPKTKDNSAALPAVNTANKETTKTESDFRNNNAGKGAVVHNSVETNPDSDDKTTAKNGNPAAVNQNSLSVDKLPEANPLSAAQHLEKCQEFIKSEKLNEALQSCTSAIELNPRNELAYSLRGNIYMIKVNFDLAVKDFNEAIILNPKNPTSFFNRGNSFFLVKKFSEAIEDYTKSIEIAPENPLYYSNRGLAYSNKKDYTKSASDFTVAIGLGWTPASIFIARGQSYYALNKFDEAIADFTRAIVIAPNNANIYRERANAYLARANSAAKNKNRNLDIEKAQIDNKLAETVEKRNP